MDRMLVLTAQVAIARGHRVEVTEQSDPGETEPLLVGLTDLDTGIRYQWPEPQGDAPTRWIGRVLDCVVTVGAGGGTVLTVDPIGSGTGAKVALRDADAAADAAKAEADRWGGTDRPPPEEPARFW